MKNDSPPAVGIDLGTTFSAIARLDENGRPTTIVNAEGDLTTPSIALFDAEDVIVGKEAFKAMAAEAEQVAECAKRSMGHRAYDRVLNGRKYPPEAIQAYILKKLSDDAATQIGEFHECVVTVPAYFDEARRKGTQDAGFMAGLEVLDIINEPTAAALSFGYQQGFLDAKGGSSQKQVILVYDLGGGTFDVTILEINGKNFRAIATDGDVQLGGRDWDNRLLDYVGEGFTKQFGIDPRSDVRTAARLWRDCEDAKRTLSARQETSITCDFKGQAQRYKITREFFEQMTHDLLERTSFTTRQTLRDAGIDWGQIDRVLMVGGSTRMPMVKAMLRDLSGKDPDSSVSADEAVAHGAALHARFVQDRNEGRTPQFHVKNVSSHSLGVVGTDTQTGRKRSVAIIPRNTELPAAARRVFKTQKANQGSVLVQIVEGESPSPDACTLIGTCVVRDLPPDLPARTPVEVRFEYSPNGRLKFQVKIAGTDKELSHEIVRQNSLTQEELDGWRTFISGKPVP